MKPRLFFCYNHQGKADTYIRALKAAGWREVRDPGRGAFILTDVDIMPRARSLREYHRKGIRVFNYPHAARPNLFWDFPGHHLTDFITAVFVPARGHEEILRAYGVPYPIELTGWQLCDLALGFRACLEPKNILFGPIHPNANGFLGARDRRLNSEAFEKILSLNQGDLQITVRYIRDLQSNGIRKVSGVHYIQAEPDGSTRDIDTHDLIISHQTFAFLAVARGVPTLMMGEENIPHWGGSEDRLTPARSWEKYKDLLMYPLDILAEPDLCSLIRRASESDIEIKEWRSRLIGETPFDPELFVQRLESYL